MRKRKSILRKLFFLCIVGVFAVSTIGCGGSTDDECGDNEAKVGGDCLQKCDTAMDCDEQGATCAQTSSDFGVCQSSGGTSGGQTGGTTGGETGGTTGGETGGTTGGETGGTSGGETGGETGGTSGGETGGETGGSSGGETGGETGGSSGGETGGETGGSSGGSGNNQCPDLQQCGQNNCASASTNIDQNICLLNKCQSEYEMCGLTGSKSCDAIVSCQNQCSQGDNDCLANCRTTASVDGQKKYLSLIKCSNDQCPQGSGSNCLLDKCASQYKGCGLAGSASCDETFRCQQACPQGDSACRDMCPDRTIDGTKQWNQVISCGQKAVNDGKCSQLTLSCLLDNCSTEWGNCGLVGQDSSDCKAISACQGKCGQNDNRCQVDCLFDATNQAQKDLFSFQSCASNSCGQAQDQFSCILTNCTNEWKGCGYTGSKTCGDILSCQQNCPQGDQSCSSNCLYEATLDEQKKFSKLITCANNNCANASNQQQCLQNNCSMEMNACTGSMN